MPRIQFSANDDHSEICADLGDLLASLDAGERMILWQALTIDILGNALGDSADTLHVMFQRRPDGQHHAQLDRITEGERPRHVLKWHGRIDDADGSTRWIAGK